MPAPWDGCPSSEARPPPPSRPPPAAIESASCESCWLSRRRCCLGMAAARAAGAPPSGSYDELVAFFRRWRAFQKPKLVDGVPDYTASAMAAQAARARGVPPAPRGDRSERVARSSAGGLLRRPGRAVRSRLRSPRPEALGEQSRPSTSRSSTRKATSPPARGPFAEGAVELWSYPLPLSAKDAAADGRRTPHRSPRLLEQAKRNLTGNGRDLWIYGAKDVRHQATILAELEKALTPAPGGAQGRRRERPPGDRRSRRLARCEGPLEDGFIRTSASRISTGT